MVEDVDWPGEPGVEADKEVDRGRGGVRVRGGAGASGVDGDAVDAPAPFIFRDRIEGMWRRCGGVLVVVQR